MTVHAHQISTFAFLIAFTLASVTADPAWARLDNAVGAGLPAFLVNESQAGDLNADGDAVDAVLHVLDTKERMAVNLGLAAASICRAIVGPPFTTCDPVSPVIGRTVVAFLVGELAQGETDSMATATPPTMCSTSTTQRPAASSTPDSQ